MVSLLLLAATGETSNWSSLRAQLEEIYRRDGLPIFIRAEADVPYSRVLDAIVAAREAGWETVHTVDDLAYDPFAREDVGGIDLPVVEHSSTDDPTGDDDLQIEIAREGGLRVNGQARDMDWLRRVVSDRRSIERYWTIPGGGMVDYSLVLRADRETSWGHVEEVLDAGLNEGGICETVFVARTGDGAAAFVQVRHVPAQRGTVCDDARAYQDLPQVVLWRGSTDVQFRLESRSVCGACHRDH